LCERKSVLRPQRETDVNKVERAVGTSDEETAVDISFFPNIAPPRPIGRLKKIYPGSASERGIEATLNLELLISANGKVKNVSILGVKLSKELPPEVYAEISRDFAKAARKILLGQQFTPPIVEGKRVPIRTDWLFRFRLEQ
jgi:hypothetical protein